MVLAPKVHPAWYFNNFADSHAGLVALSPSWENLWSFAKESNQVTEVTLQRPKTLQKFDGAYAMDIWVS